MNVSLVSLWLPIVLAGAGVFIVSSLLWTVVQHHNGDWKKLPDEEAVRSALRGAPVGQYTVPHAADGKARAAEDWQRKFREGPAGMVTILPHGHLSMGRQLATWFLWCIGVALFVGYIAGAALPAGAAYLKVFQVTATTTFIAYAGAVGSQLAWFGHSVGRSIKDLVDALAYGLVTGGVFGWLWP